MKTHTKSDMLSCSDRWFRIAFFYFMPALFICGLIFLWYWHHPVAPVSSSEPAPKPRCHYRTGIDVKSGVSVSCLSYERCVVCSVGECSTFDPRSCPKLKP